MKTRKELIERIEELKEKSKKIIDDIQFEQRFGKKSKEKSLKNVWLLVDNEIKVIKWILEEEI